MALQPQHLAVHGALGDVHVDDAAVREADPLLGAPNGVLQVDVELGAHIRAPLVLLEATEAAAEPAPAAAALLAAPAEHLAQDVVEVDPLELGAGALEAIAEAAWTASGMTAAEAAHGLAPVRVDLAAVELLALLIVTKDVEGCADPLEPLLGLAVARVLVGVQLLGELAEGLADLLGGRAAGHAQLLIWILRQRQGPGEHKREDLN